MKQAQRTSAAKGGKQALSQSRTRGEKGVGLLEARRNTQKEAARSSMLGCQHESGCAQAQSAMSWMTGGQSASSNWVALMPCNHLQAAPCGCQRPCYTATALSAAAQTFKQAGTSSVTLTA